MMSSSSSYPPMPLLPITSKGTIEKCKSLPLRRTDVFVCSYPKSGTTWTQHIILSLILADARYRRSSSSSSSSDRSTRKDDDGENYGNDNDDDDDIVVDYDHVSDLAPFFEIDAHWEVGSDDLAANVRANHARLGRRVFNTHLRWDMLPKGRKRRVRYDDCEDDGPRHRDANATTSSSSSTSYTMPTRGKFVYVIRHLPDACASFFHHLSNQVEGTYERDFADFAFDWMDGNLPFGSPLHHLLSYAEGFSVNRYHPCYDDDVDVDDDDANESMSSSSSWVTSTARELGADEYRTNVIIDDGNWNNIDCGGIPPRHRPLLLISYEMMKSNLRGEVLRIIDFLGLDAIPKESLHAEILPKFDFRFMRENSIMFQPRSVTWLNGFQFLRMGIVGDGRKMMMETTVRDGDHDDGSEGDGSLMRQYRNWVNTERYHPRIGELMCNGLEMETAKRFNAAVTLLDE